MQSCDLPSPERSRRAIEDAVVLGVAFPAVQRTLLLDLRDDATTEPRVAVAVYADSPCALAPLLMQHFGGDGAIARFTFMPWRQSPEDFATHGSLDAVIERFRSRGMDDDAAAVRAVWDELRSGAAHDAGSA